ncbi:SMYD2-like protein [Mya arenaria]|uniref:SMYD2-like protein n=1 Tax=Mya arenaria TaxID=6604 RepID=A0ABY7DQN9_MYAAR|nr:uncharacterized protein LOC128228230 [Mya arenaria]WAQ99423.1 SMYD2-like protein [Mya arenaria]
MTNVNNINCNVCETQLSVMKRCTKCKSVFYCSRECQVKDWPKHQISCKPSNTLQMKSSNYRADDNSIFGNNTATENHQDKRSSFSYPPLVDFSKAVKGARTDFSKPAGKSYLSKDEYHTDVPELNEHEPAVNVSVKCNKDKHKLTIQTSWCGSDIYKYFSYALQVPLQKLKVIHKGKVLCEDNIKGTLKEKAVYQVIGEVAENEDNVDQRDIAVMMHQMGLDRNAAVKVLKQKGDLLDALLDQ